MSSGDDETENDGWDVVDVATWATRPTPVPFPPVGAERMAAALPDTVDADRRCTLRCPTCNAEQPWSDACRRCRCDLGLLHQALRTADNAYQSALRLYGEGRVAAALPAARLAYEIDPQPATRRLWAICALRAGDFATAARLARLSVSQ